MYNLLYIIYIIIKNPFNYNLYNGLVSQIEWVWMQYFLSAEIMHVKFCGPEEVSVCCGTCQVK